MAIKLHLLFPPHRICSLHQIAAAPTPITSLMRPLLLLQAPQSLAQRSISLSTVYSNQPTKRWLSPMQTPVCGPIRCLFQRRWLRMQPLKSPQPQPMQRAILRCLLLVSASPLISPHRFFLPWLRRRPSMTTVVLDKLFIQLLLPMPMASATAFCLMPLAAPLPLRSIPTPALSLCWTTRNSAPLRPINSLFKLPIWPAITVSKQCSC